MRGLFITGTDTGVGKTVLSAALVAAMASEGERVSAYKPVVTGVGEEPQTWPQDHELLAQMAGMTPQEVAPLRYAPAVSPHLAAAMAGELIESTQLVEHARRLAQRGTLIVEGVGGLLVPLSEDFTVRDLAVELALPLLIAARPGLGTINHTLLTLHAARAAGLEVHAVVLTPWPREPSAMEASNRETIAHMGEIDVSSLAPIAHPTRNELAQAGTQLPWQQWLD
ncbi:MAG TPA: dethiobiotin synthase [Solirubrobacteraceae bacterium]